jgi:hypothetical protein
VYRYRPEVLEQLALHGLNPKPSSSPQFVRDALRDLYNVEIRALRDRCRAGEFSTKELPGHVVELRKRYILLSIPVDRWTDSSL